MTAQITQTNGTNLSALLRWTPSANTENDLVGYRLYVSNDGGITFGSNAPAFDNTEFFMVSRTSANTQVGGLQSGTTYNFTIRAVDEVLNESAGVSAEATPDGSATQFAALSGTIDQDITLAAGVYRITGSVTVSRDATLRLLPGAIPQLRAGLPPCPRTTSISERLTLGPTTIFIAGSSGETSFGNRTNAIVL